MARAPWLPFSVKRSNQALTSDVFPTPPDATTVQMFVVGEIQASSNCSRTSSRPTTRPPVDGKLWYSLVWLVFSHVRSETDNGMPDNLCNMRSAICSGERVPIGTNPSIRRNPVIWVSSKRKGMTRSSSRSNRITRILRHSNWHHCFLSYSAQKNGATKSACTP